VQEKRKENLPEIEIKRQEDRPYFQRLRYVLAEKIPENEWSIPQDIHFEKVSTFPLNRNGALWKLRLFLLGECIEEGVGETLLVRHIFSLQS
jgi:hypothetical protein